MIPPYLPFLLVGLCAVLCSCAPPTPLAAVPVGSLTGADLNPQRGLFQWSGMQVVSPHQEETSAPVVYRRFTWNDLWADGKFNFRPVTSLFDTNPGSQVAFRIRSFVDYGTPATGDAIPRFVPGSIPGWEADTSGDGAADVFVPDWNSEAYLAGTEALWNALATELALPGPDGVPRNQRIAWIDVGMYGQYGEWYLRTAPSTSRPESPWVDYSKAPAGMAPVANFADTAANTKKRLVDAQLKAFPNTQWVMFFLYEQATVLDYLFFHQKITSQPVGWRFDALGSPQFLENQWQNSVAKREWWQGTEGRPGFQDRWKTALVVAESVGPGADPTEALRQVRDFHVGMVGNGNFTPGSGTDRQHWSRLSEAQKAAWLAVGQAAGWRLTSSGPGTLVVSGPSFSWSGSVTNPGNAPAWGPWGGVFVFGDPVSGIRVPVTIDQGFPLPDQSVVLQLRGTVPSGLAPGTPWRWVPTVGGRPALWSGPGPAGNVTP